MKPTLGRHRQELMKWLLQQERKPYLWRAKGPNAFDCSGLVTCGLVSVGYPAICPICSTGLRGFHNAHLLWTEWKPPTVLTALDCAFYGTPDRASHVVFLWPDGRIYGANCGDRTTTTIETAQAMGAQVGFRSSPQHRKDFLGFRALPLPP